MSELDVEKWTKKAEEDLDYAEFLLKGGKYTPACFFAHQCVEKILKALIIKKTNNYPKIHDLVGLGKLVDATEDILYIGADLNSYYIETRYVGFSTPTEKHAKEAVNDAKKVLQWAKGKL